MARRSNLIEALQGAAVTMPVRPGGWFASGSQVRRPRDVYSELSNIVNEQDTARQLGAYLNDPLWDDLKDLLAEVLAATKPVYFYLDAVDEEFGHAPMHWLRCQEGLFYQVMRLLRDIAPLSGCGCA